MTNSEFQRIISTSINTQDALSNLNDAMIELGYTCTDPDNKQYAIEKDDSEWHVLQFLNLNSQQKENLSFHSESYCIDDDTISDHIQILGYDSIGDAISDCGEDDIKMAVAELMFEEDLSSVKQ
ncbi:hypothetical protein [Photobacterium damselae]|uniref:hypothetical protein n=1 Tax=Photobacterium damselae TaxID=38293 RepID=UPI004067767F